MLLGSSPDRRLMKDETQSPAMALTAERAAATRDPLRIAALSFARASGQAAAGIGDHLSILDPGRALAANGLYGVPVRQACRGGSARTPTTG